MLTVKATAIVEVQLDQTAVANALYGLIIAKLELPAGFDDGGVDWKTIDGMTFVAGVEFSDRDNIATLVDAMNILKYGNPLAYQWTYGKEK